uniref:Band 7 domain-containing protein n=1 Tax=Pyrodinium bahamense TaxID=73915 RepID=A0A7S0AT63_9DINO|mmetsp:Transcript_41752/g.116415  ORF Transcript_41752/g.116415 Transcript_41752/m.116415 type:complete len:471 (+) Transcript_41752:63-1475(+)
MGSSWGKWVAPAAHKKDGTTLATINIHHIRDAHDVIGLQPDAFTPVVVVPQSAVSQVCCVPCCWTSIPSGFTAIVTRWGADVPGDEEDGGWSPGFHCFPPWYAVNRLVSKQLIIFDTPVKECKTQDNITVNIDVLIVLEIVQATDFIYGIGPEKLDDLLRCSQEEILRQMASETPVERIYDLHGANTEQWVELFNGKLGQYGVRVHHFTVTNVVIPQDMASDFEAKTLYESKTLEKQMQQESDRLTLNIQEEQQKLREECDNARMAAEEEAVTTKAQITKEVAIVIAESDKDISLKEAQRNADVLDVTATAEMEIATTTAEIMRLKRINDAGIEKEVGKLEAEAEAYEKQRRAKAKMESSATIALGKKALAEAEGEATTAFAARREQEQEMARLKILEKLADNSGIRIVTSMENNTGLAPDNSLVAQIAQQGMEAFRMKLAEMTSNSVKKLEIGKVISAGLVRPVPQMQM